MRDGSAGWIVDKKSYLKSGTTGYSFITTELRLLFIFPLLPPYFGLIGILVPLLVKDPLIVLFLDPPPRGGDVILALSLSPKSFIISF